jgi:hypothetical protein
MGTSLTATDDIPQSRQDERRRGQLASQCPNTATLGNTCRYRLIDFRKSNNPPTDPYAQPEDPDFHRISSEILFFAASQSMISSSPDWTAAFLSARTPLCQAGDNILPAVPHRSCQRDSITWIFSSADISFRGNVMDITFHLRMLANANCGQSDGTILTLTWLQSYSICGHSQ